MIIFQYILQGIAHEINLFFNFIDFAWFFFVFIGVLIVLVCLKEVYQSFLNFLSALLVVIKIPIILLGILIILGMYILTAYLFDDSISFYFAVITIIASIKDIINFYSDFSTDMSMKFIINSLSISKGVFLILFIRIINMIDVWNFTNLKYIYVYIIYIFVLLFITFSKKIYIIIDEHRCRCRMKGGNYNRIVLLIIYCYAVLYLKNFNISSDMLLAFYNHNKTSILKKDLEKVHAQSFKIREIMKRCEIDRSLLKK